MRSAEQRIALPWVPACATSASDHILSPTSFSASRSRGRGGGGAHREEMALLMSRAGPRNPPAPRESAEEQSQGCCEGAGSEQPCPRHRSAGQEAGEGAEDPAAGHQPQTRTGNKAEGGEGGTAPGAAAEASPRRGERRTERCSGSSRAPGGSLTAENGRSRAGLFGVASPSTRTHTQAHTHPLSPREPCPRLQGVWEGSDPTSPHTHTPPPPADPSLS